jgi:hypothetical protein
VARFLGAGNVVQGTIRSQNGGLLLQTQFGEAELHCTGKHAPGEAIDVLLRGIPDSDSGSAEPGRGRMMVTGRVEDVVFQRDQFRVELAGGLSVYLREAPQVGEQISVPFEVKCLNHE